MRESGMKQKSLEEEDVIEPWGMSVLSKAKGAAMMTRGLGGLSWAKRASGCTKQIRKS